MAQLDQLDFLKLFLEANGVRDPVRVCQQLFEHGVTTLTEFAELSLETLQNKWRITDWYVCNRALPRAQALLADSSHDIAAIRQPLQLLVRARMHYMYVCTIAE